MNDEINYKNNPLHGLSLKKMLVELVEHYGYEILFAYLNINCFSKNPSVESSVKFLKKTDWAREKVESFYLYQYKSLPRASDEQFELSPRDRIIPEDQAPGEPAELSLEDAQRLQEKRAKKAEQRRAGPNKRSSAYGKPAHKRPAGSKSNHRPSRENQENDEDPWAKWRK